MKLMKKALAMILAAVMIFSTMAIGVSAANGDSVEFKLKFVRYDEETSKWVETTKVKPGEEVRARVYVGTNYDASHSNLLLFFDKGFLDFQLAKNTTTTNANKLTKYQNPDYPYIAGFRVGEYETYEDNFTLQDAVELYKYVDDNTAKSYGFEDIDDMVDKCGFITAGFSVDEEVDPAPFDSSKYLFELPFKVNDNEYVRKVISATSYIPLDFVCTINKDANYTDIFKIESGVTKSMKMFDEDPALSTTPATISINSSVTYDPNSGAFDEGVTNTVSGLIDSAVPAFSAVPKLAKNAFKGWSKTQNQPAEADADEAAIAELGILGAEDLAALKYGYEDLTLYAVWQKLPPADVKYDVNLYFMGTDGTYGNPRTSEATGKDGQKIEYTPEDVTGFTVDEEAGNLSVDLVDDPTPVAKQSINVYYKRNQHDVVYKNEKDEVIKTFEDVYFGDEIPSLETPYAPTGYDVSWTYDPAGVTTVPDSDLTIKASLTPKTYDFTFSATDSEKGLEGKFGDEAGKVVQLTFDAAITDPKDEITPPEGYEFDSWSPALPEKVTDDGAKEFEARYKAIDYTVTYKVNYADGTSATLTDLGLTGKHIGDKINVAAFPVNAGKEYTGWTFDGATYAPAAEFEMPAKNVEFVATESKIEYTYTFNAVAENAAGKFDDEETTKTATYYYGEVPALPEEEIVPPTGYQFDGWSEVLPDTVTESKTFTAKYKAIDYSITYVVNNAPVGVSAPAKVEGKHYNDKVVIESLPAVGDGYEIDGWYNGDKKVEAGSEFTMPADNVTLTADVSTKKFKINFDAAGGEAVESLEVEFGKPVESLPVTTKDDYDFAGWVDGVGAPVESIDSMPANDIDLTAQWTRKEYKITYKYGQNVPEGAPAVPAESKSISGETITVAGKASLAGWEFDGWKYNGVVVTTFEMPKENVELIGEWRRKGGNVNFYLAKNEDGTPAGEPYDTKWVDEGETISLPENDPSRIGSTFTGWVDKDGNELPDTMPDADIDVFAKFELHSNKVTYYDADGTTVLDQFDVTYGSEIPTAEDPVPPVHEDPENYEYVFAGWTPANTYEYMPDQALNFTATYVPRRLGSDHTVTYKVDGKTIETYIIHSGDPMQKPEDPKKFGKTFIGWNPEVPDVMPDYDITFEAQWETNTDFNPVVVGGVVVAGAAVAAIATAAAVNTALITGAAIIGGVVVITGIHHVIEHSYNVTYKVNGEVYRTFRIIEGAKIIVPADPTKEGAEFKGWNPEVPERMPAEDIVFEAVWSDSNSDNPATGSSSAGLAAFAAISTAAVAAFLVSKKKKEDEE